MTDWNAANVKCPFYISEGSTRINCEGPSEQATFSTIFLRAADKKGCQSVYCNAAYQDCMIYKMLMNEKYGQT
ncbi:MAG: hypothetical protein HFE77_03160 [Clostridiales bacterium]|nr:hypothetical protein [Clostridiales bacterium]